MKYKVVSDFVYVDFCKSTETFERGVKSVLILLSMAYLPEGPLTASVSALL